jgi:hypothetical protein
MLNRRGAVTNNNSAGNLSRVQVWARRKGIPVVESSAIDGTGLIQLMKLLRANKKEFDRLTQR